jgi:hypothetical protein
MGKKRVEAHGIYIGAIPFLADIWEDRYEGQVVNNLLDYEPDDELDDESDDKSIHVPIADIDDMIHSVVEGLEKMDEAKEIGADTMEISKMHIGKSHNYYFPPAVDLYFYEDEDEDED